MWFALLLTYMCLQRTVFPLAVYPYHMRKIRGGVNTHIRIPTTFPLFVKDFEPSGAPLSTTASSEVECQGSKNKWLEVSLPRVEGVDLEDITDLILELCPGVLSVSTELVEEETYNSNRSLAQDDNNDTLVCTDSDRLRRWESLVQGTSAWLTTLLRLHVSPSFQTIHLQNALQMAHPDLLFTIAENAKRPEEPEDDSGEEWMLKVQKEWPPMKIGDLTIYFPWHNRSKSEEADIKVHKSEKAGLNTHSAGTTLPPDAYKPNVELTLEGGAAFGTGDHPTTRLCVHWLSRIFQKHRLKRSEYLMQQQQQQQEEGQWSVLDYGCGSAILALAALRFGVSRAVGVDIDYDALRSAQRNCALNHLHVELHLTSPDNNLNSKDDSKDASTEVSTEDSTEEQICNQNTSGFDITLANIIAPVLIPLAPSLASFTKSGGKIALSGVLGFQAEAVISAYKSYFDDVCVEDKEGEWVLITGVRKVID